MAHISVQSKLSVYPILGMPGVGYESVIDALKSQGFDALKGDDMGFRTCSLRNEEWHYDPMYVWRKSIQLSEDDRVHFISFGGGNFYEIAVLPFQYVIFLDLFDATDEQFRRMDKYRHAVELPPLTNTEKEAWTKEYNLVQQYILFLRTVCNVDRIYRVNALYSPSQIASNVLSICRLKD